MLSTKAAKSSGSRAVGTTPSDAASEEMGSLERSAIASASLSYDRIGRSSGYRPLEERLKKSSSRTLGGGLGMLGASGVRSLEVRLTRVRQVA